MVGEYELIYPLIVDLPFLNMQFIFPVRKKSQFTGDLPSGNLT